MSCSVDNIPKKMVRADHAVLSRIDRVVYEHFVPDFTGMLEKSGYENIKVEDTEHNE